MQRNSLFSYQSLTNSFNSELNKLPQDDTYIAYGHGVFYILSREPIPGGETQEGNVFEEYGLKFHISLPENESLRGLAWDLVKDILIEHQLVQFKVVRSGYKMSDVHGQAGKDITIYAYKNPEKNLQEWQMILQKINDDLSNAQIPPGAKVQGTVNLPEVSLSPYISYRYDLEGGNRKRKLNKEIKLKNWPDYDYCENLKITSTGLKQEQTIFPINKIHTSSSTGNKIFNSTSISHERNNIFNEQHRSITQGSAITDVSQYVLYSPFGENHLKKKK